MRGSKEALESEKRHPAARARGPGAVSAQGYRTRAVSYFPLWRLYSGVGEVLQIGNPHLSEVCRPHCFYERPTLVPVFAN